MRRPSPRVSFLIICLAFCFLLLLKTGHFIPKKEIPYQIFLMYGREEPEKETEVVPQPLLDDHRNSLRLHGQERINETYQDSMKSTNLGSESAIDDLETIYRKRRERISEVCNTRQSELRGKTKPSAVKTHIMIDRRQNFAYCGIQKSASTFWKRVFRIVVGQSKATSPFDPSVKALLRFDQIMDLPENQINSFMGNALSFMFVREPFGRLFSGYVDKLFSPNVMFWRNIGSFGAFVTRDNPNKNDLKCGHDLTFREFVKTILYGEEHNKKRNGHFTPQYEHCHPCEYKYDVIGTLETLPQDTFYLLDKMGKTDLKKSLMNDFRGQSINDTIRDQAGMLFAFRHGYHDCKVSFYEAQRKMWKKFQIRGVLSKNAEYPISREQSERITADEYKALIFKGIGDAANKTVAKRNKEEALLEAYSTVDKKDMTKLSELFKPDCELFGYDCRPKKLFDLDNPIDTWYFDTNTA